MSERTVKGLFEELSKYPPGTPVIMSKDGEGNDFSPYADTSPGNYAATTTWYGEMFNDDDLDGRVEGEDYEKVVVLWPVN